MTTDLTLNEEDQSIADAIAKAQAQLTSQHQPRETNVSTKMQRLNEMLAKTGQYSEFIAGRLRAQQQEMRMQEEEESKKKAAAVNGNKTKKQAGGENKKRKKMQEDDEDVVKAEEKKKEEQQYTKYAQQPSLVTGGKLRNYQMQGVEWIASLYENGLNGILADEMGLGKTLQTLAFIARCIELKVTGPFLIVAPLSTVSNWLNEIKQFIPSVEGVLYHGTRTEREAIRQKELSKRADYKHKIFVTSFEIAMIDAPFLNVIRWGYLVIDEGHRLKNMNCRLIKELKTYVVGNKLLLSGTPLQNNLDELWSLLNFLMPELFDDLDAFNSWFQMDAILEREGGQRIMEAEARNQIVSKMHAILKPFLLRRTKYDVEAYLPPKKEYMLFAPLTKLQREFYDATLNGRLRDYINEKLGIADPNASAEVELEESRLRNGKTVQYEEEEDDDVYLQKLEEGVVERPHKAPRIEKPPSGQGNMALQHTVMQLRKICNHPLLFDTAAESFSDKDTLIGGCGKFLLLDKLIPALIQRKHRILIFCQMTRVLDILEEFLESKKLQWCRIDGAIKQSDRQADIDRFNKDPNVKVFLLSTRAGGLGINLTSADTVILYDSDWNPQMDLQAQDRVHRIGQTKPVLIYRLVTANSIESKILERAGAKRRLEKLVIQRGAFKTAKGMIELNGDSSGVPKPTGGFTIKELAEVLKEDAEEVEMDDASLLRILDRSPSVFVEKAVGEEMKGKAYQEVSKDMLPETLLSGM